MNRERIANTAILIVLVAIPVFALLSGESFYLTLGARIAVLALAAVGLNILLGLGGLVSFGHATFFGLGGYVSGILSQHALYGEPIVFGLPGSDQLLVAWLMAILVSGVVGLAVGVISLRTSGVYFIMITLAFAQMFFYFSFSWSPYGGEDGLSISIRNALPGIDTSDQTQFVVVSFVLLFGALLFFSLLRRSRFGAALQASRQSEARLAALGVEPFKVRLVAFVISGMITALAGVMFAELNRFVSPAMFAWTMSGDLIVIIIIGGVGRLFGPVAGTIVFVALEYYLGAATERWQLFLGLALLAVVLFARGGVMGALAGKARHG